MIFFIRSQSGDYSCEAKNATGEVYQKLVVIGEVSEVYTEYS